MVGILIFAIGAVFALYAPYEDSPMVLGLLFVFCIVVPRVIDYPLTLFMARKGNVPLSYQSPVLPVGHTLPSGTTAEPLPIFPKWVIGDSEIQPELADAINALLAAPAEP